MHNLSRRPTGRDVDRATSPPRLEPSVFSPFMRSRRARQPRRGSFRFLPGRAAAVRQSSKSAVASSHSGESLEQRTLLAGTLTVGVEGGVLTLTGDGLANQAVATVTGPGIQIVGLNGTTIVSEPGIDLNAAPNVFAAVLPPSVEGVVVRMGGGNDRLRIDGGAAPVAGNITVNMGSGNDAVVARNLRAAGDITVLHGGGLDRSALLNSAAGDDILARGSDGNDAVSFANVAAGDDVIVRLEGGADGINAARVRAGDDISVRTGEGASVGLYSGIAAGDDVLIKGGDSVDQFTVAGINVGDDLQLDGEDGNDVIALTGARVADNTKIEGDGGVDVVAIADDVQANALLDFGTLATDLATNFGPLGAFTAAIATAGAGNNAFDDVEVDLDSNNDLLVIAGVNRFDNLDLDGDGGFDYSLITPGSVWDDIDYDDFELGTPSPLPANFAAVAANAIASYQANTAFLFTQLAPLV